MVQKAKLALELEGFRKTVVIGNVNENVNVNANATQNATQNAVVCEKMIGIVIENAPANVNMYWRVGAEVQVACFHWIEPLRVDHWKTVFRRIGLRKFDFLLNYVLLNHCGNAAVRQAIQHEGKGVDSQSEVSR